MKQTFLLLIAISLFAGMGFSQKSPDFKNESGKQSGTVLFWEGFEDNGNEFPDGWTQEFGAGTVNWNVVPASIGNPATVHSGDMKARWIGAANGNRTILSTPPIDLSTGVPILEFWYTQEALGTLRVYYKTSAEGEWVLLQAMTAAAAWAQRIILLPNLSATYYIGFEATAGVLPTMGNIQLDNVSIIDYGGVIDAELRSITAPANGLFTNLTNSEPVTVVVKNNGGEPLSGFDIEVKVNGAVSVTETYTGTPIPILGEAPYTLTATLDLSASGDYEIIVTVLAEGDQTPQNNSRTVRLVNNLVCPDIIDTFPWVEDFERFGPISYTGYPCWERINIAGTRNWLLTSGTAHSGTCYLMGGGNNGAIQKIVPPPFDLSELEMPTLKFWWRHEGNNPQYVDTLLVYYKPTQADDWTRIHKTMGFNSNFPNWNEVVLSLPNASSTYYIAFESHSGGTRVHLDDVSIVDMAGAVDAELLSIEYPFEGTNYNLTENEQVTVIVRNNGGEPLAVFDLTLEVNGEWIATESYSGAPLEYGETIEYTFTATIDLSAHDDYEITVTVIAEFDSEPYNDSKTILLCNCTPVADFPFLEGFESVEFPPKCWTSYDIDGEYVIVFQAGLWRRNNEIAHNGTASAYHSAGDPGWEHEGWLVTPLISIPNDGTAFLEFWSQMGNEPGYTPHYGVWVSTTGNDPRVNEFTLLKELTGADITANSWKKIELLLSDYAGQNIFVGFKIIIQGSIANYWAVDDVEIKISGSLSGMVTDAASNPLANAKVEVEGTSSFGVTNQNGAYSIENVEVGIHNLIAIKYGYVKAIEQVTVSIGNTEQNFILQEDLTFYSVSGKVIGNDTQAGLSGVTVKLWYEENEFTTSTDSNGDYEFNVCGGYTFNIKAEMTGYFPTNSTVTVTDNDVIKNLTLNEIIFPIVNVVAVEEGNNVVITWEQVENYYKGGSYVALQSTSRVLTGYTVYRLVEEQPEASWTLLSDEVPEPVYTDYTWSSLPANRYQWAVKAIYTTGGTEAKLSNVLVAPPKYTVTFAVKEEGPDIDISGASIVFNGELLSGYVAFNVLQGEYPYTVSHDDYHTKSGTVTVVDQDVAHEVKLLPLGIGENVLSRIVLYPNPFTNEIYINHPELVKNIQVTDVLGQVVKNVTFNGKSVITENLSSGIYLVILESFTGEKLIQKVVKK